MHLPVAPRSHSHAVHASYMPEVVSLDLCVSQKAGGVRSLESQGLVGFIVQGAGFLI